MTVAGPAREKCEISLTVNGQCVIVNVFAMERLLDVLRQRAGADGD